MKQRLPALLACLFSVSIVAHAQTGGAETPSPSWTRSALATSDRPAAGEASGNASESKTESSGAER